MELRSFHLSLMLKPDRWEFRYDAVAKTLYFRVETLGDATEKTFALDAMREPDEMLRAVGGPFIPEMLAVMGIRLPKRVDNPSWGALGIRFDGRQDHRLKLGRHTIRCLRFEAVLLDRYAVRLYARPDSGEILKIDLPQGITLYNEPLLN